jgi:Fe-S-cluster containining protein
MEENSVWECLKCGKCCGLFVRTGPGISDKEKEEIFNYLGNPKIVEFMHRKGLKVGWIRDQINEISYIPLIGDDLPKKCIFLSEGNLCVIHEIRPEICRDYPLDIASPNKIKVDLDCPRSKQIIEKLKKGEYPFYIKNKINTEKDIEIEEEYFFERKINMRG